MVAATRGRGRQQRTADFMNIEVNETLSFDNNTGDPRDEIARLESRLDELADSLSRCWKFKLISQIAIAGGGAWLLAAIFGIIGFDPVAMTTAIAGVIGGTVMYGSNTATVKELEAEMNEAEAKRAALIGTLDLRVVGE
jgi:hypothetical protein